MEWYAYEPVSSEVRGREESVKQLHSKFAIIISHPNISVNSDGLEHGNSMQRWKQLDGSLVECP